MRRFIVIVKATADPRPGQLPADAEKMFAEMGRFNEEMIAAGVMLDGAGLKPSSAGARVAYGDGEPKVIPGPFGNTTELVSGFWIIQCRDLDEAIGWIRRAPFSDGAVEIRPFMEPEDFAGIAPDEVVEQEKAWRDEKN